MRSAFAGFSAAALVSLAAVALGPAPAVQALDTRSFSNAASVLSSMSWFGADNNVAGHHGGRHGGNRHGGNRHNQPHRASDLHRQESERLQAAADRSVNAWSVHTLEEFPNYSLRVKETQELCDPDVKQYVGYIDVEGTDDVKHFFFWFFESRSNPSKDPLILWLNGGPGCSSLTGLLMELGPCRVNPGGNGTTLNKYSWNNKANLVFLDQPINVGFSYTDGSDTVTNTVDSANDVYAFLELFLTKYPKYQKADFHVTGESYAGHYIPAIGAKIYEENEALETKAKSSHHHGHHGRRHGHHHAKEHKHRHHSEQTDESESLVEEVSKFTDFLSGLLTGSDAKKSDEVSPVAKPIKINLKSLAIGNGLTDPLIQYEFYADMAEDTTYGPIMSEEQVASMRSKFGTCRSLIDACYKFNSAFTCVPSAVYCNNAELQPFLETGLNIYDIRKQCDREKNPLCYDIINDMGLYLNLPEVQEVLGVDRQFEGCKQDINLKFLLAGDWMKPFVREVPPLLDAGIRVLIYAGDADFICNWIGNKAWTMELEWSGTDGFQSAKDEEWVSETTGRKAGQLRTHGGFSFLRVYNGGHMLPYDQPEHSEEMINTWISVK